MSTAYLSLGSNIEPRKNFDLALKSIRQRFGDIAVSPVYRSRASGFQGPDFLNAAVRATVDISPDALKLWLQDLEGCLGRDRTVPRFSDRTMDIDIVLYDDLIQYAGGDLIIPHPQLVSQQFVLKPMADLAPGLSHPVLKSTLLELWNELSSRQGTTLVREAWT